MVVVLYHHFFLYKLEGALCPFALELEEIETISVFDDRAEVPKLLILVVCIIRGADVGEVELGLEVRELPQAEGDNSFHVLKVDKVLFALSIVVCALIVLVDNYRLLPLKVDIVLDYPLVSVDEEEKNAQKDERCEPKKANPK